MVKFRYIAYIITTIGALFLVLFVVFDYRGLKTIKEKRYSHLENKKTLLVADSFPLEGYISFENGNTVAISYADTDTERQKGLSGTPFLSKKTGLFFIFPKEQQYGFWMKDMFYPIDIIWISSNKTVVDISKNIPPESFPEVFYPSAPSRYVLEVPSGTADDLGIKIGDQVSIVEI